MQFSFVGRNHDDERERKPTGFKDARPAVPKKPDSAAVVRGGHAQRLLPQSTSTMVAVDQQRVRLRWRADRVTSRVQRAVPVQYGRVEPDAGYRNHGTEPDESQSRLRASVVDQDRDDDAKHSQCDHNDRQRSAAHGNITPSIFASIVLSCELFTIEQVKLEPQKLFNICNINV